MRYLLNRLGSSPFTSWAVVLLSAVLVNLLCMLAVVGPAHAWVPPHTPQYYVAHNDWPTCGPHCQWEWGNGPGQAPHWAEMHG